LGFNQGDFPIAEKLSREVLSLPIYPGMNIEIAKQITFHLKNFLNNLSV
jgi:dTDP-4-amino-4,6-dideoxygalactose transaminase